MVAAVNQSEFCKELASALVQLAVPRKIANEAARKLASVRIAPQARKERTLTGPLADLCTPINEAARKLGISRTTAYSWLRSGKLGRAIYPKTRQPILKVHGMTVVSSESVQQLLQSPIHQ